MDRAGSEWFDATTAVFQKHNSPTTVLWQKSYIAEMVLMGNSEEETVRWGGEGEEDDDDDDGAEVATQFYMTKSR